MKTLFIVVLIVWLGSELVLSVLLRARKSQSRDKDDKTLAVIYGATTLSIVIATAIAWFTDLPIGAGLGMLLLGLLVIVAGMALRIWSMAVLGRHFTYNVAIFSGHRLIHSGPYRVVRHPSYTGLMASFVGYGLCLNNWLSVLAILILVSFAFGRRINVEEVALRDYFGEDYRAYMLQTWRLIPFIY